MINFSKYDANSEKVVGDPLKKVDYDDKKVIVIDDVICSGETLERAGGYLAEEGARKVDSIVMENISDDFNNVSKGFEGVLFSLVKKYVSQGVVTHPEPVFREKNEVEDLGSGTGTISLADL